MVCMGVSRFLKFPIQIIFSEKIFAQDIPLSRVLGPDGVGGYMRKRVVSGYSALSHCGGAAVH